MPQSLDESVIRILNSDRETVGTGFMVADYLAVTCAHVVFAAGGQPGGNISVRFYLGKEDLKAQVLPGIWSPKESDDIAFLRLPVIPANTKILKLDSAHNVNPLDPYTSLGFPKGSGQAEARRPSEAINGLIHAHGRQDWLELKGNEMNFGMSGAPILDLAINRVVGMVTYHVDEYSTRIVYATTTDAIKSYFPELVFAEPEALSDYRQQLLRETQYILFTGIPLPIDRHGRAIQPLMLLEKVYIRLRAVEDKVQREKEATEQKKISEKVNPSLNDVLVLGEYLYQRGFQLNEKNLSIIDPEDLLRKYRMVTILGAPGSGKSTLLRWLARKYLAKGSIPILVPLREYAVAVEKEPTLTLREYGIRRASLGSDEIRNAIEKMIKDEQVLWLVDALDEARTVADKAVRETSGLPGKVILTSRPVGFVATGIEDVPIFEILSLTDENVEQFIINWFEALISNMDGEDEEKKLWAKERTSWLFEQLHERNQLAELTRNPLLLTFLATLTGSDPIIPLPETRPQLYDLFIRKLYETWERKNAPNIERERIINGFLVLGWSLHLAYYGGKAEHPPSREAIVERLLMYQTKDWFPVNKLEVEELINFWQRAGLLETWQLGTNNYLTFRHLTFQEFSVASVLKQVFEAGSTWKKKEVWKFLLPRLHIPEWREPILLLFGLLKHSDQEWLIQKILHANSSWEIVLRRDLRLLIRMISDSGNLNIISNTFVKNLTHKIILSKGNAWIKKHILDAFRGQGAKWGRLIIETAYQDEDSNIRASAVEALGILGGKDAVREALHDVSLYVRTVAVRILERQGTKEDLNELRRMFTSSDFLTRSIVLQAIGSISISDIHPELFLGLFDKYSRVRQTATMLIERVDRQTAHKFLILALADPGFPVRYAAVQTSIKIKDRAVLARALSDPTWQIRLTAANALFEIGDRESLSKLSDLVWDPYSAIRITATKALIKLDDRENLYKLLRSNDNVLRSLAYDFFLELDGFTQSRKGFDDRNIFFRLRRIEKFGLAAESNSLIVIEQALNDDRWQIRFWAVEVLSNIDQNEAISLLRRSIWDQYFLVRQAAIEALGRSGDIDTLIKALKSDHWDVRKSAIDELGKLKNSKAIPYLQNSFSDVYREIRISVVQAIGEFEDARVVPFLHFALEDKDENVRATAIIYLEKFRDREGLLHAIEDSSPLVVYNAAEALGSLGYRDVVPTLRTLIRNSHEAVRIVAIEALGKLHDINGLIDILIDEEKVMKSNINTGFSSKNETAELQVIMSSYYSYSDSDQIKTIEAMANVNNGNILPEIRKLIHDDTGWIRKKVIDLLARIGDREALYEILIRLQDEMENVRVAAAEALGIIGDQDVLPELRLGLLDESPYVRIAVINSLVLLNDRDVLPELRKALQDDRADVRRAVVNALGELDDQEALLELKLKFQDRDEKVREAALEAVKKITSRSKSNRKWANIENENRTVRSTTVRALLVLVRNSNDIDEVIKIEKVAKQISEWELLDQAVGRRGVLELQLQGGHDLLLCK